LGKWEPQRLNNNIKEKQYFVQNTSTLTIWRVADDWGSDVGQEKTGEHRAQK
jgi:hypothetical protein